MADQTVNIGASPLDAANLTTQVAGAQQTMETPEVQDTGALPTQQKTRSAAPTINANQLNPKETAELLARMQEMIDNRTGGWHDFMGGLQDTMALATPPRLGGPTQAMASREATKRQEQEDVFNMRAQMADIQAKQRLGQQQRTDIGNTLANLSGGAGTSQGYDQNILNQVQVLANQGDIAGANKLLQSHMQETAKINRTARTGDTYYKKTIEVETPNGIEYVSPAMIDEMNLKPTAKGRAQLQIQRETPTTGGGSESARASLKRGIFGQESDLGTADTSKPNAQGVQGPMQIKDTTFTQYQDLGVIPKNFRIDNPSQNKAAGDMIVDYLYDKHGGDARKVAAEYYGGPGAINKDGTINISQRNALRPQDPTVGQYIDQVLQKSGLGLTAPQQRVSGINAPITAASRAETAAQEAGGKEYATQVGKSQATEAAGVDESYKTSGNRLNLQRSSLTLLEDPDVKKLVGYLDKPGVGATILRQVRDGITFGRLGDINLKDFDANLAKTGATQAEIDKFNKLINNLRTDEAQEARAAFKGQGAVSDMERKLIAGIVGNISNSAESVKAAVKWRLERAQFDNEMGRAFNEYRNKFGDTASFGKFMRTDGQRIIDAHNDRLAATLGIDRAQLEGNRGYDSNVTAPQSSTADDLVNKYKSKK